MTLELPDELQAGFQLACKDNDSTIGSIDVICEFDQTPLAAGLHLHSLGLGLG
jgi:hypothetical protein